MKDGIEKKWFTVSLTMALVAMALAACGTKQNEPAAPSAPGGGTAAEAPKIDSKTMDAIKKRGKLVAGVKYDTMLFGLKDPKSGNVEGFDIDMAKAIAKSIFGDENKLELKEVTSKTRIQMLQNGDIDIIIATMTINEERKKAGGLLRCLFHGRPVIACQEGQPDQKPG